jgi:murein DD-endopeptidase MepM/ murein hydrolase activator NlpD
LKKIGLPFVIILTITLMVTILVPQQGSALTKLEQAAEELKRAEARQKEAEQNLKNAQSKIQSIKVKKQQTANDIKTLEKDIAAKNNDILSLEDYISSLDDNIYSFNMEIEALGKRLEKTNQELALLEDQSAEVEAEIKDSKHRLQKAIERIERRSQILRERLRFMYTNGSVSYMEVLMSSTGFSDFLVRFDHLKSIVGHDKTLLESNRQDYETITVQIAEVEQQLAQLDILYENQIAMKEKQVAAKNQQIEAKEKQNEAKHKQVAAKDMQLAEKGKLLSLTKNKKVEISNLVKEEKALAHYTEEQERAMIEAAALVASSKKAIAYYKEGGKLAYPLPELYRVSSNFGIRIDPITGKAGAMHNGMDFAAPAGTSILAAESGIVITAGWVGGYGNTVILDHGNDTWTLYAHARKGGIQVVVGQTVSRGDKISEVGTTGNSTGNHLHFEVRVNQKAVDPRDYLSL